MYRPVYDNMILVSMVEINSFQATLLVTLQLQPPNYCSCIIIRTIVPSHICSNSAHVLWVTIVQYIQRLATGWKVRGSNPGEGEVSHTSRERLWGWLPGPWLKRPGRGVDHPLSSRAEVKQRVQLHIYSPSGPLWSVLG